MILSVSALSIFPARTPRPKQHIPITQRSDPNTHRCTMGISAERKQKIHPLEASMPLSPNVFPAPVFGNDSDSSLLSAARAVTRILTEAGFKAFFAGGFARDILIHRAVHDIDIATDAQPDLIQKIFPDSKSFGKS